MKPVISSLLLILLAGAYATGCSTTTAARAVDASLVEVEFFVNPYDRQVFGYSEPEQVKGAATWVEQIRPGQPLLTHIGAVGPWCKVSFFEAFPRHEISTITVYRVLDRKAGTVLISPEQEQTLLDILGLAKTGEHQYIRKPTE